MHEDIIEGEVVELDVVETKAGVVMNRAEGMLAHVESLGPITTDAQNTEQSELLAQIKSALKGWEEDRKSLTDPLVRLQREIKARYDSAAVPAKAAQEILNGRIKSRWLELQEAARKEQRRLDALAAKKMERAKAKAEAKGEEAPEPIIPMPTVAAPAKTVQTTAGRVTVREIWTWKYESDEVTAIKALIAAGRTDLLQVNEKAVSAGVKAGVREIPGIVVHQELAV